MLADFVTSVKRIRTDPNATSSDHRICHTEHSLPAQARRAVRIPFAGSVSHVVEAAPPARGVRDTNFGDGSLGRRKSTRAPCPEQARNSLRLRTEAEDACVWERCAKHGSEAARSDTEVRRARPARCVAHRALFSRATEVGR